MELLTKKMVVTPGTVSKKLIFDSKKDLIYSAHIKDENHIIMTAAFSGGFSINWFSDVFLSFEKERLLNIN